MGPKVLPALWFRVTAYWPWGKPAVEDGMGTGKGEEMTFEQSQEVPFHGGLVTQVHRFSGCLSLRLGLSVWCVVASFSSVLPAPT